MVGCALVEHVGRGFGALTITSLEPNPSCLFCMQVYSLHKSSTRAHVLKMGEQWGAPGKGGCTRLSDLKWCVCKRCKSSGERSGVQVGNFLAQHCFVMFTHWRGVPFEPTSNLSGSDVSGGFQISPAFLHDLEFSSMYRAHPDAIPQHNTVLATLKFDIKKTFAFHKKYVMWYIDMHFLRFYWNAHLNQLIAQTRVYVLQELSGRRSWLYTIRGVFVDAVVAQRINLCALRLLVTLWWHYWLFPGGRKSGCYGRSPRLCPAWDW